MKIASIANMTDLDKIIYIDREVIGNNSRGEMIKKAIELEHCIIVKEEDAITGFLIYDTNFFGCSFILLIIISPSKRRKGYASKLIEYMMDHSPTQKVFSSTNRSNVNMQKVFKKNGFTESGIVENLDEGDPEIIYFRLK
ncbi:GNAT family N-acetyltransferase [Alkalihalophilus marmarensis]|uniref:GNAT family N-acetyltransferase n=1 Tax=Alkalihalophilus marmarensis TaxID=521377 RepID=UPI002E20E3B0|nr:GNAT family N-acetyltransferase [Alkalihalophilus marmarensis]